MSPVSPPSAAAAPTPVPVARQPICDERRAVVAYEVLLGGEPPDARATARLVVEAFAGAGLEELVGARPAHLHVSAGFLLEVGAPPVRLDRVVLEVDAVAAAEPAVAAVIRDLALRGYALALRGVPPAGPDAGLLELAGTVVLDARELGADGVVRRAEELRDAGVTLLARGVDTHEQLERFAAAGCRRFQGGFLAQPRAVADRRLPGDRLGALATVAQLEAGGWALEELEPVIRRDVGLSYKLLRYVSSAFFGLGREVRGVGEAIVILGQSGVRRWATVMALAGGPEIPEELVVLSLCRARMCERLGAAAPGDAACSADELFTVGLFSVVDALLDLPLERVLTALPLATPIKAALLRHEGPLGATLARVKAWERGEFAAAAGADPPAELAHAYRQALSWATAARSAMV